MYFLRKTYQKYIVVEKSEEKGSKENWYLMAYPRKKGRDTEGKENRYPMAYPQIYSV